MDDLHIGEIVGSGGMGSVFKAQYLGSDVSSIINFLHDFSTSSLLNAAL